MRKGHFLCRSMFVMVCALLAAAAGYAQSGGGSGGGGSCTVTQLRLMFTTGDDDLRGGKDNLNVIVYFTSGGSQAALNVNKNQNWPNGSVNTVEISLNRPTAPNEIRALRLFHVPDGSFSINLPELATPAAPFAIAQALQSPDNWNMNELAVAALGNGIGARIANYGFHRFTGSDPSLTVYTQVPANICGSGRPSGNSGGSGSGSSNSGSGLLLAPRSQGILSESSRTSTLLQDNRVANNAAPPPNTASNNGNQRADELSPQPYPPKGISPLNSNGKSTLAGNGRMSPSTLLKAKLPPARKGPAIINRARVAHVQAVLTTLHNQKQAADIEAAQMTKLPTRVPGKVGTPIGPSQPMSASAGGSATEPHNQTAANTRATDQTGTTTPLLSERIAASAGARLGPSEALPVMCSQNPTLRIVSVSGSEGPITFTTDPSGNFYTITGCSFGNTGPNAKAYIYYQNSFHQEFQIQEWNDNFIKCNLDPSLTGVGDLNNLTLVVQRSDGQQTVKTGFQFYAMRETRRLTVFPQQYFSLYKFGLQDLSGLQSGVYSPVNPTGYFPNSTAEVKWSDPGLQNVVNKGFMTPQNTPPSGTDIYDFSHLSPGFDVTEAYINSPDPSAYCSALGLHLTATTGSFGGQWNGAQLWITWQGWNCNWSGSNCNFWGCTDVFGEPPLTDYAVDIVVEGPRGVDPWTGQPTGH